MCDNRDRPCHFEWILENASEAVEFYENKTMYGAVIFEICFYQARPCGVGTMYLGKYLVVGSYVVIRARTGSLLKPRGILIAKTK